MREILQLTLLYDFYGELLTEKQKLVYDMYYQNDLSLSEIGEELSISRQAVRDQIKRVESILQNYSKEDDRTAGKADCRIWGEKKPSLVKQNITLK